MIASSAITNELEKTVASIARPGKGILAADESTGTISKRFNALKIPCTEESRKAYRELLFTSPGIEQYISGITLFEETLYQKPEIANTFPELLLEKGIIPGVKVDKGLINIANSQSEKTTQGLDGLAERLETYKRSSTKFVKWREVFSISDLTPSRLAIQTNAENLARYAAICQEIGLVPIIEPEVLIDGNHTLIKSFEICEEVLHQVFHRLHLHKVVLEHIILKPSMVTPGKTCLSKTSPKEIAEATIQVLCRTVPCAVPSINFLSGGQSPEDATQNLNSMHRFRNVLPWNVSFSFSRALQEPCMKAWLGKTQNILTAQDAFIKRAKLNSLACLGEYDSTLES